MPSPAEVSDALMDGLNEHYGNVDSEVFAESDGTLLVALRYTDGDRYALRIEPDVDDGQPETAHDIHR